MQQQLGKIKRQNGNMYNIKCGLVEETRPLAFKGTNCGQIGSK